MDAMIRASSRLREWPGTFADSQWVSSLALQVVPRSNARFLGRVVALIDAEKT